MKIIKRLLVFLLVSLFVVPQGPGAAFAVEGEAFSPPAGNAWADEFPNGTANFKHLEYKAEKGKDSSVTVSVVRFGGTQGKVSIDYSLLAVMGSPGRDFGNVSGTLVFAEGETEKSFDIAVIDDGKPGADCLVSIILSNPQGGLHLGVNDQVSDANAFAQLLRSMGVAEVQLLPFHQFGERKHELLGRAYPMAGVPALHEEDLADYRQAFLDDGVAARF